MTDITLTTEDYPDDPDLLIPVSAVVRGNGGVQVTAYADTRAAVQEYIDAFPQALFSREAAEYLRSVFDPEFARRGYALPEGGAESDIVYRLDALPVLCGASAALCAEQAADYPNLTDIDLDEARELGQRAYVCVEDGKTVCVAVVNFTQDSETEIAVETAAEYRRRGYAYAACAALCADILSRGERVLWRCSERNTASCALAEKLGFFPDGRELYLCYYKTEEE